jgi:Phosphotransferase enzyme family
MMNRDRAVAAAMELAAGLGLSAKEANVLHESNRLAVRLLPSDTLVRVAEAQFKPSAEFEVRLALELARAEAPAGTLEPRVAPRAYAHDGFVVTFWSYYEPAPPGSFGPADYARALEQLHACMRQIDMPVPHFTYRVSEAQRLVGDPELTPALTDGDRAFVSDTLHSVLRAISARGRPEQRLHCEPHPGNVLRTKQGVRFIDLETCCRGPIEFDLAHAPEEVAAHYPGADEQLIRQCRILMLAMVAAWRWDRNDRFPNGAQAARDYISALRVAVSGGPVVAPGLPTWDA